jgi:vanillate/4-hydroxybenzoate decarboxylase subunit D
MIAAVPAAATRPGRRRQRASATAAPRAAPAGPHIPGTERHVHTFPRPEQQHPEAEREPVEGTCPACGASALAAYRVVSEGGWWNVRKCRSCLHSLERAPGAPYGSFTPLGLQI